MTTEEASAKIQEVCTEFGRDHGWIPTLGLLYAHMEGARYDYLLSSTGTMVAAKEEIARLQAENDRLRAENDEMRTAFGDWRCTQCDEWQDADTEFPEDGLCETCRADLATATERAKCLDSLSDGQLEELEAIEAKLMIKERVIEDLKTERDALRAELAVNAALLALRTDLARQAEMERDEARKALAIIGEANARARANICDGCGYEADSSDDLQCCPVCDRHLCDGCFLAGDTMCRACDRGAKEKAK